MIRKGFKFDVVGKLVVVLLVVAVLAQAWIIYDMMKAKSSWSRAGSSAAPPTRTKAQRDSDACPLPPLPSINPTQAQPLNQSLTNRGAAPSANAPNNASANQLMGALRNALASHGGGMTGGFPSGRTTSPNRPLPGAGGSTMNHPMMGMGGGMMDDPFADMARLREMMDRMMGGMGGGRMSSSFQSGTRGHGGGPAMAASPRIDLDQNDNYVVTLDMPGLEKSEIEADVNGRMLTISGVQRSRTRNTGGGFNSMGQSYQRFQTSFSLPGPVKSEKMKLDYAGDTLTIHLPRA